MRRENVGKTFTHFTTRIAMKIKELKEILLKRLEDETNYEDAYGDKDIITVIDEVFNEAEQKESNPSDDYNNYDYLRGFVDGYGGEEPHDSLPEGFDNINQIWDRIGELKQTKSLVQKLLPIVEQIHIIQAKKKMYEGPNQEPPKQLLEIEKHYLNLMGEILGIK